jgi:prepilin-type N-terminal cleavage/methylation domain-containing protein
MLSLKRIFNNCAGYSLVEIMIALGILSVGTMITMKTVEFANKQVVKTKTQVDFDQLIFAMENYIGRKDVCTKNFKDTAIAIPSEITSINPPDPEEQAANEFNQTLSNAVFTVPSSHLGGKANIIKMELVKISPEEVPALRVTFDRKDSPSSPTTSYVRVIPMVHELDAAGTRIQTCYESNASLFDMRAELAERICNQSTNGHFDNVMKACHFYGFQNQAACRDGQAITGISLDQSTYGLIPNCGPILTPKTCPGSTWIKSIDANGKSTCLADLNTLVDSNSETIAPSTNRFCGLNITAGNKIKFTCSGSPCTPPVSCSTIAAGICVGQPAGSDSCGNSCGMGSMTGFLCANLCTPDISCSQIAAEICTDVQAGADSCGTDCGIGTNEGTGCCANNCAARGYACTVGSGSSSEPPTHAPPAIALKMCSGSNYHYCSHMLFLQATACMVDL